MSLMSLYTSNTLRHIWAPETDRQQTKDAGTDFESGQEPTQKSTSQRSESQDCLYGSKMLDFDGPKLIEGYRAILKFHQLFGFINWTNKPLYICIVYKLIAVALSTYYVVTALLDFLRMGLLDGDRYKNPILLFISFAAYLIISGHVLQVLKMGLCDLSPVFKILTTPKLCFLRTEVLQIIGDRTLTARLIYHWFLALLVSLATTSSLLDFSANFNLLTFVGQYCGFTFYFYHLVGLSSIDLYIRSAFGFWLMGLRGHLKMGFTRAHELPRRLRGSGRPDNLFPEETRPNDKQSSKAPVSFEEILRNLNNMDDHLEAMRSIHEGSLVVISLQTFLGNGTFLLVIYNLVVFGGHRYHGAVLAVLAINTTYMTFMSYFGDRWLYYALSSFVQTVEDEYFMQLDHDQPPGSSKLSNWKPTNAGLVIHKKDVLFCREFLHQFENHLATPWSKLTFKSHLHILRTFVTLMAAQIIFDSEH